MVGLYRFLSSFSTLHLAFMTPRHTNNVMKGELLNQAIKFGSSLFMHLH